ncbi:MAG: preprotein translocase subunit SecY, partial [Clostridia bacterium]|nr:preprotein translocase subunit SecY [Clostridia bacterium]
MIQSLKKMWKIEDLRKKLLYTFGMLILFRLVGVIPAPGVDIAAVMSQSNATQLPLLELVNMMTGNAFSQMTIMAMGITPYINASIIMQLLCIAIPALERMQKEEDGREKIAQITRYVTVGLAAVQAIGLVGGLGYTKDGWYNAVLVGVSMAGGSALAMWIGEKITEKGIGNGISLLIFAGIISNLFNGIISAFATAITTGAASSWIAALSIILLLVILIVLVTFVDLGERRIPLQIAKQVKGRRVYGGQNTHMSLKVVSVGVL